MFSAGVASLWVLWATVRAIRRATKLKAGRRSGWGFWGFLFGEGTEGRPHRSLQLPEEGKWRQEVYSPWDPEIFYSILVCLSLVYSIQMHFNGNSVTDEITNRNMRKLGQYLLFKLKYFHREQIFTVIVCCTWNKNEMWKSILMILLQK